MARNRQIAQICVTFPRKTFRHGEKIRPPRERPRKATLSSKVSPEMQRICVLSHRFFCKTGNHRFFDAFRQNLQILLQNQAPARPTSDSRRARRTRTERARNLARETPSTSNISAQKPGIHTKWMPVEITANLYAPRATDLWCCAWLQPAHTGASRARAPRSGPYLYS